jgi:hypothetical protein
MTANPYAQFIGDRDPRNVIAQTPDRLAALARQLGPAGLERSLAPGKWCAREILCHLADCEVAFAWRLRQTLAEPGHVTQPFDQDRWAKPYPSLDAQTALAAFSSGRLWNNALLNTLTPEDFATKFNHPERGEMTLETIVETMAGHDLNHLGQIEKIASS